MKGQRRPIFMWLILCLSSSSFSDNKTALPESFSTVDSRFSAHDSRPGYVGDLACAGCHSRESTSYEHTAHRITSQLASEKSVLGDFLTSENLLTISDQTAHPELPSLYFKMERKGGVFTETAVTGWGNFTYSRSERIDVVTGSGVRGQTYLFWKGDRLFELPVSYWSDGKRWVNSPGYADGTANFSRPVNPGCLECHATYILATSAATATNSYLKDSLITGIACETCHGPGAAHASKYSGVGPGTVPEGGTAILNPAKFSRDRQVDTCAVCHSGIQRTPLKPPFSFVPGKPFSDYFAPLPAAAVEHPDVHGNQVGLLERSRCFQNSPTLSCTTCHDVHTPEKATASYSEKCLVCHTWQSCGISKTRGIAIKQNCIDCHMPTEPTNVIVSETAGKTVRSSMRNHWIKIYPAAKSARPTGL